MRVITHNPLVPRLKITGAMPLFFLNALIFVDRNKVALETFLLGCYAA
jgi:hypothetical protein